MGRVDHGRDFALLDAIRKTECNLPRSQDGITQHMALSGRKNHRIITFLDTPRRMRPSRDADSRSQVTDVVVLVVAADDGVMPQTARSHRSRWAAKVPIVVAINKIDKAKRPESIVSKLFPKRASGGRLGRRKRSPLRSQQNRRQIWISSWK